MAYRFKARSVIPGQCRLATGVLAQLVSTANIVDGVNRGDGGLGIYPTTAFSKAAQLADDVAAVEAAKADILGTRTILSVTGTRDLSLYQLRPVVGSPVAVDLSNDYGVFDGLIAVTCYSATSPPAGNVWKRGAAKAIANARIEKINLVEVEPSAGVYDRADTRIRLPATLALAVGYTPAIGDVIVDTSAAAWIVLSVGKPRFDNSWSCNCRQLLLAGGLCHSVTLLSATVTNVHGSKVVAHNSIQRRIAARIQPLGEMEVALQQRLGFDVNYVIYTATDLETKFDDLLQDDASGVQYEIKSSGARRRIDVLSAYYCRVRP